MRRSVAVVRGCEVARVDGDPDVMNAASLVKQVVAHLTLEFIEDLDEPVLGGITVRQGLLR